MQGRDADLERVKWICHKFCASGCVDQKRRGVHLVLLRQRPHWSVLRRQEQFDKIDLGAEVPFDMALPLPARERGWAETAEGVELFNEIFKCQRCGRCCYTPGAGLVLESGDFERIGAYIGSKKRLRKMCRHDKAEGTWILRQPCPFYGKDGCEIYPVRPLTCTRYPLHPPLKDMPYHLAVDAFCPAARQLAKETLGWWIVCENNWARILRNLEGKP